MPVTDSKRYEQATVYADGNCVIEHARPTRHMTSACIIEVRTNISVELTADVSFRNFWFCFLCVRSVSGTYAIFLSVFVFCCFRHSLRLTLLRGTIVNRTYGTPKNLYEVYFLTFARNIWSYLLWPPVILLTPHFVRR